MEFWNFTQINCVHTDWYTTGGCEIISELLFYKSIKMHDPYLIVLFCIWFREQKQGWRNISPSFALLQPCLKQDSLWCHHWSDVVAGLRPKKAALSLRLIINCQLLSIFGGLSADHIDPVKWTDDVTSAVWLDVEDEAAVPAVGPDHWHKV